MPNPKEAIVAIDPGTAFNTLLNNAAPLPASLICGTNLRIFVLYFLYKSEASQTDPIGTRTLPSN